MQFSTTAETDDVISPADLLISCLRRKHDAVIRSIPCDIKLAARAIEYVSNIAELIIIVAIDIISLRFHRLAVDCHRMRRGADLQACTLRQRCGGAGRTIGRNGVPDTVQTEYGAAVVTLDDNLLAGGIGYGHLIDIVSICAFGDLHICNRTNGIARAGQFLADLFCCQRDAPGTVVGFVRILFPLQIGIIAAPYVNGILGRAAIGREEVADDRFAVIGQVFALRCVNRSIRSGGCLVRAKVNLTVCGVAQS